MTERVEAVADADFLQMQTVAGLRHWFELQAAQFYEAQALILQTGGDIDDLRRQKDTLDNDTERAICMKAIDALSKTRDSRKLAKIPYGTDIYRQHVRNAAITLLGQRAANSLVQADLREQKYLDGA